LIRTPDDAVPADRVIGIAFEVPPGRGPVQAQVAGDAGGGPSLGCQADGLGAAAHLVGHQGVGLQFPQLGVFLRTQVDTQRGWHGARIMEGYLGPSAWWEARGGPRGGE